MKSQMKNWKKYVPEATAFENAIVRRREAFRYVVRSKAAIFLDLTV